MDSPLANEEDSSPMFVRPSGVLGDEMILGATFEACPSRWCSSHKLQREAVDCEILWIAMVLRVVVKPSPRAPNIAKMVEYCWNPEMTTTLLLSSWNIRQRRIHPSGRICLVVEPVPRLCTYEKRLCELLMNRWKCKWIVVGNSIERLILQPLVEQKKEKVQKEGSDIDERPLFQLQAT